MARWNLARASQLESLMPLYFVCVISPPRVRPLAVALCLAYSSTHSLLCAPPCEGLMQEMVTITHNSRCAEMLATVRRGPFARSTQEERIEFLLTRMRKQDCKVAFADHALEHVLSFQRRVQSIKQEFLRRGASTPLGIPQETFLCFFWGRLSSMGRGGVQ